MDWLTIAEAAQRADKSAGTIRRWIREARLPATSTGGRRLIEESDLEAARSASRDRPAASGVAKDVLGWTDAGLSRGDPSIQVGALTCCVIDASAALYLSSGRSAPAEL